MSYNRSMFGGNRNRDAANATVGDLISAGVINPNATLSAIAGKIPALLGKPGDTGPMGDGGLAGLMEAPVISITNEDIATIARKAGVDPRAVIERFREAVVAITTNPTASWASVERHAPNDPANAFYEPFGLGYKFVPAATSPGVEGVVPGRATLSASTVKAVTMNKLVLQVMGAADARDLAIGTIVISGRTYSQQGLIPGTAWSNVDAFPNFNGVLVRPSLPVQIELYNFSGTGILVCGSILGMTQD